MKKITLVGQRFGRLSVVADAGTKNGRTYSACLCDCGKEVIVSNKNLRNGHTKSCGCYKNDIIREIGKVTGRANVYKAQSKAHEDNVKHGMSKTRLYRIWQQIKQRCYNKNSGSYKYYGGKGVRIFEGWKDNFEAFSEWAMDNGYSDCLTIDRIDSCCDYEPQNCRWITQEENSARIQRDIRYWCVDISNGRYVEFDNISKFCRDNPDIANENHVRYAVSGKCLEQQDIIFGKF